MQSTSSINPDHLRDFYLAFGKALNIAGLEGRLCLPNRTLRHWMKGEQALPAPHLPKVLAWAQYFGYDPSRQYDAVL